MHALVRCRPWIAPALLTALITGCGGGGDESDSAPAGGGGGRSGVTIDKSGVWTGDTILGTATLIIDADGEVLGFSRTHAVAPDLSEYRTIVGSVGDQSEYEGPLDFYTHGPGLFGTEHTPIGGRPETVTVTSNFIPAQAAEFQLAGSEGSDSLIYTPATQRISLSDITGTWRQVSIHDAGTGWMEGAIHVQAQNRTEATIEIQADGSLTGTETQTGWNWLRGIGPAACLPPCGGNTDVWALAGQISETPLSAHNVFAVEMHRKIGDVGDGRTARGYLYAEPMLMILRDTGSDLVVYTYTLRRDS